MSENLEIKNDFKSYFYSFLEDKKNLKFFFYDVFCHGSIYAVGGYFRDFLNYKKSRDLDLIADVDSGILMNILENRRLNYSINRHNGIKLTLDGIEIDIWCIEDNWAFKNNLVKLNERDKLLSIAKGCFYNYDALVINLNKFTYNLQYYANFVNNKTLDILQKNTNYKTLNPTIEANIIRAFYLKNKYQVQFSTNTQKYLIISLKLLQSWYKNDFERLLIIKNKYPKYSDFSTIQLFYELEVFKSDIEYQENIQLSLF